MSVKCPNCGQKTEGIDCQWCHYPLAGGQPGKQITSKVESDEPKSRKSWSKYLVWPLYILLGLIVVGFAFMRFSGAYEIYLVRSESMKPVINMGDMVINGPVKGALKPGMIITYKFKKGLITHRVVSVDGDKITTKGDAVEDPDPWTVSMRDVQSTYLFKIPYLGYIPGFIQNKKGWFIAIIAPTAVLVGLIVKDIIKESLKSS